MVEEINDNFATLDMDKRKVTPFFHSQCIYVGDRQFCPEIVHVCLKIKSAILEHTTKTGNKVIIVSAAPSASVHER